MALKFIYRIDDIHPAMNWNRFWRILDLYNVFSVVPLLGLIPDNRDRTLNDGPVRADYAATIKKLVDSGRVEISQHGFRHLYSTNQHSLNQTLFGRVGQSEFAGIPYGRQLAMIKAGQEILRSQGLFTETWMAPSHTSDSNTYRALRKLGFKYVTDGLALYPFRRNGLIFVPQQVWQPKAEFPFRFGIFTVCLHLNELTADLFRQIERHLQSEAEIIPFSEAVKIRHRWYYPVGNALYKLKRALYFRGVRPIRQMKTIFSRTGKTGPYHPRKSV